MCASRTVAIVSGSHQAEEPSTRSALSDRPASGTGARMHETDEHLPARSEPTGSVAAPERRPGRARTLALLGAGLAVLVALALFLVVPGGGSGTAPSGAPPSRLASRSSHCIPDPASCGYPDGTNTGWRPTGVHLKPYPVEQPVFRTPGQVIDGYDIVGPVRVEAAGVTIRRSRIRLPAGYVDHPHWTTVVSVGGDDVTIEDSEVSGLGPDQRQTAAPICISMDGAAGQVRRADVNHCGDGMRGGRYTVTDSWFHDFWLGTIDGAVLDTPHADIWQSLGGPDGSHITIRHNTGLNPVKAGPDDAGYANSVFQCGSESGPLTDVVIEGNLIEGGGYAVNVNGDTRGLMVRDNRFGRAQRWGLLLPHGAPYTWQGNEWDDSGATAAP